MAAAPAAGAARSFLAAQNVQGLDQLGRREHRQGRLAEIMGVPGHDRLSPGMVGGRMQDRILEVPGRGGKRQLEHGSVDRAFRR